VFIYSQVAKLQVQSACSQAADAGQTCHPPPSEEEGDGRVGQLGTGIIT